MRMKSKAALKKKDTENWLNDENSVSSSSRQEITFNEVKKKIASVWKLSQRNKKPNLQDKPQKAKIRGPIY